MLKRVLKFVVLLLLSAPWLLARGQNQRELSQNQLWKIVTSGEHTSVEDVLLDLPYGVFQSALLIYDSRSILQEAGKELPRVILSNPDKDFYLAYGGDSDARGGNSLEGIVFNGKTKLYELFRVDFQAGKPVLQKNPRVCMGCHSSNGVILPVWDTYDRWPGAYGSFHHNHFEFKDERKTEVAWLRHFMKKQKDNPRYSNIIASYIPEILHEELVQRNILYSNEFVVRNAEILVEKIKAHPNYQSFRIPLILSVHNQLKPSTLAEFLDLPVDLVVKKAQQFFADNKAAYEKYVGLRLKRMRSHHPKVRKSDFDHYAETTQMGMAYLRIVLEQMGLDHYLMGLSPDLMRGSMNYQAGADSLQWSLVREVGKGLTRKLPGLKTGKNSYVVNEVYLHPDFSLSTAMKLHHQLSEFNCTNLLKGTVDQTEVDTTD